MQKKWTKNELLYLIENYNKKDKEFLIKQLDKSWSGIQNKAFSLKIKRSTNKVSNLINGSLQSYYWLGFIMADGHFSKRKTLEVNLAIKDIEHLRKLSEFLEQKIELRIPRLSIVITEIWDVLVERYKISSNKTYSPCSIETLSGDELFAFSIGFMDGDGTISKGGILRVKCHSSWLDNIKNMLANLSDGGYYNAYINNENLAFGFIAQIELLKRIKNKIVSLELPYLKRKWDLIPLEKLSKKEISKRNQINCFSLFEMNKSINDVINQTNLSSSQVYKQRKNYLESIKQKDIKREVDRKY